MSKPLLSVGIIFKNEIRCLERCLKSLEPLRKAVPCEVVMADTGSDDGSRMVAEKYADILFDFPWINDFAAARNAVMDRCTGKWYLCIDCDEWLDGDIKELIGFITTEHGFKHGGVVVRNYQTVELDQSDDYSDFYSERLLLMSTGLRFVGAIHERIPNEENGTVSMLVLQKTILHHDGYVYADAAAAQKKNERNMTLLRKHLEEDPKNITTLLQCIESSDGTAECLDFIKRGTAAVEEKWQGWQLFGGPILRYAAVASFRGNLPELEKYIDLARELFPKSIYTRIDVEFAAFGWSWQRKDYEGCIRNGERYLQGLADYESGNYDRLDSLSSTLTFRASQWKTQVLIFMAASYLYEKQPARTVELLRQLDGSHMNVKHVGDCIRVYTHLHSRTDNDAAAMLVKLWEQINAPIPSEERGEQRKNEFIRMSSELFLPAYQEDERKQEGFCRHAYTMFLPLRGKCVLGDMAAILETGDPAVIEEILSEQEHYDQLPTAIMFYALEHGVGLPLKSRPMKLEEMDGLIFRMAKEQDRFLRIALDAENAADWDDWQEMCWARGLLMAAVRAYPWSDKEQDEEQGMAIARAFARVEREFVPRCYSADALREDRLFVLPPLHRFGWYCAQAFQALEQGRNVEYVQSLRCGLESCEGMKPMVEFLVDHTKEVQMSLTTPELRDLADQVRVILARFSPDDPEVAALKQTDAYQKVAHLIEGTAVPVWGGQQQ